MFRHAAAITGALILSASCNKTEGGDSGGGPPVGAAPSAAKPGSGGGFSADLAKELGSGDKPAAGSGATAGSAVAGSDGKPAAGSAVAGSDGKPAAGSAVAGSDGKPAAGSAVAGSDGKPAAEPRPSEGKPTVEPRPSEGKPTAEPKPGDGKPSDAKPAELKPGEKLTSSVPAPITVPSPKPTPQPASHGPVKVPAELAAIKLSLLPNWDRDIDEAGTFQYVVRIKGTQDTKTFTFHYGYDDAKAPADHDQYKKYLQDAKLLTGDIKDRQRGGAWFLEGLDATGAPSFRYQVLYGGKRLVCYGSLYKDVDSNKLGDDRDQTVIQAKQICETLAL
jgi:hypothetical protein